MESWNDRIPATKVKEYTAHIPGWPGYMDKLIDTTPGDGIIDWKIMWRDPQEVWTSPLGRVVQVGDAAHTFNPMSGHGATQGMEDGISLATCLELGGKDNVNWATRVNTKLRQVSPRSRSNPNFSRHFRLKASFVDLTTLKV